MFSDPKRLGWIVGFIAAVMLTWFFTRPRPPEQNDSVLEPLPPSIEQQADAAPAPNVQPRMPGQMPPNPIAMRLNDPALTAEDDVENVHTLLVLMRTMSKGPGRPLGLNEEFTAALAGDNPTGMPFLPPDHQAINAEGELTDRWGNAYHFHPIATDRVEIRSAGPDGRLFNADDIVYSQWGKGPE
ncbi:MAG: hypothetical protein ACQKBV_02785 [Puniceicoccales bacterium]